MGKELVVNSKTGTWRTVGNNGAEFTKIGKEDIVFNHKQTKKLLENGKIFSRGKALAKGNISAYDYNIVKKYELILSKKHNREKKYMGNVDLNHRPIVLDGKNYHTLLTGTMLYSDFEREGLKIQPVHKGDKAFNYTPIYQNGKWIKDYDTIFNSIYDFIENGNKLLDYPLYMGSYKSLESAEKAAISTHNDQAKMYDEEAKYFRKVTKLAKNNQMSLQSYLVYVKKQKKGYAKVNGTAFANGKNALVGELGTEMVVDPNTNTWKTVGENGAEFVNLPKNAIVFNHKQTKKLLSNGYTVSRGKSLDGGKTIVDGLAFPSGGTLKGGASGTTKKQEYDMDGDKKTASSKKDKKSSKKEKDKKTPLEEFQDWLSKLFDWIEIRLNRLSSKTEKYFNKAEQAFEKGYYSSAASNYKKAISGTKEQISTNTKGASMYENQATKILNEAVKRGLINNSQSNTIKKRVADGSIDISQYGEKMQTVIQEYQNWYEKSVSCKDALIDLNKQMEEYYTALYNLPIEECTKKIEKLSETLDVLKTKTDLASSGGIKTFYKTMASDKNKEIDTAKNTYNVAKSVRDNEKKQLSSKLRKRINSKTGKINTNGLNKQEKEQAVNYNKTVDNLNNAKKDYTKTKQDYSKYNKQYKDSTNKKSYEVANSLLDKQIANAEEQRKENLKAEKRTSKQLKTVENKSNKTKKTVTSKGNSILNKYSGNLTESQKKALQSGKTVSTKGVTNKKELAALNAYNKAVKSSSKATEELRIAKKANTTASKNAIQSTLDYTMALQENSKAKLDNIDSYYSGKKEITDAKISSNNANIDLKKSQGKKLGEKDYKNIQEYASYNTKNAEQAYKEYYNAIYDKNGNLTDTAKNMSEEDLNTAKVALQGLRQEWIQARQAEIDYADEVKQLKITDIENQISVIDSRQNKLENYKSVTESRGNNVARGYYTDQIKLENDSIKQQKEKKLLLEQQLLTVEAGSEKWMQMFNEISDCDDAIAQGTEKVIEFNKGLKELDEHIFERTQERIENIIEETEFLIGLMSDTKMVISVDDKQVRESIKNGDLKTIQDILSNTNGVGNLTKEGLATVDLYLGTYNQKLLQGQEYLKKYKDLEEEIGRDESKNTEENRKKLEEYRSNAMKYFSEANSSQKSAYDIIKQGYEAQIDLVQQILDKRKQTLDTEKSIYEYQKNIKKQTKDIASLQQQYDAWSKVNTEEAKNKAQQLKVQLEDSKTSLQETVYDRYLSDQSELMDEFSTDFKNYIEDYISNEENKEKILKEISNILSNDDTEKTVEKYTGKFGYGLSDDRNRTYTDINTEEKRYQENADTIYNSNKPSIETDQSKIALENVTSFINEKLTSTGSDSKDLNEVNKYIKGKTGKILKHTDVQKLGEYLGVGENETDILKALKKVGYSKGGFADKINKTVQSNGDDGIITIQKRELVLTQEQTKDYEKFIDNIDTYNDKSNVANAIMQSKVFENLIPVDSNMLNALQSSTPQQISAEFNFNLPNVTDTNSFLKAIQNDNNIQKAIQNVSIGRLGGSGKLSVNRIK